jgi:hypothetical protein
MHCKFRLLTAKSSGLLRRAKNPSIELLRAALDKLPGRDAAFAESMIRQYANQRRLSDKQWHWGECSRSALPSHRSSRSRPMSARSSVVGIV